ncbi:MAG: hypothetical protein GXP25_22150 [Planctomycetes bacterium]|nr:hypothetical protein [Planctomycetota bacterium]
MKKAFSFAFVLFGLLCCLGSVSLADIVHLKSGKKWEGEIVEETAKEITLDLGTIKMKIRKADIEKIEKKAFEKAEKKKKKEGNAKGNEEGQEKGEEKPAEKAANEGRLTSIPPPPEKQDLIGYRYTYWGTHAGAIQGIKGQRDTLSHPDYFSVLDPPEDIARLIPENYEAPHIFTNVYYFEHGDWPEYKTVLYYFNQKLYAISGRWSYEIEGIDTNYAEFVVEQRKDFGGETSREKGGALIWDTKSGYAKFEPESRKPGPLNPTDPVKSYKMQLYSKELRQKVFDWIKENLKK